MHTTINEGNITFTVDSFLATMSHEERMYIAKRALYDKMVLKDIVNEIINEPPRPLYYEARKVILEHTSTVHRRLVHGLLSEIEMLKRWNKVVSDRWAKVYYSWPEEYRKDRPQGIPEYPEKSVSEDEVVKFIDKFFEERKNENSA